MPCQTHVDLEVGVLNNQSVKLSDQPEGLEVHVRGIVVGEPNVFRNSRWPQLVTIHTPRIAQHDGKRSIPSFPTVFINGLNRFEVSTADTNRFHNR